MPSTDPLMSVDDRLPLTLPAPVDRTAPTCVPQLFGLRFAVDPVPPSDKHGKTYYTVKVKEATHISKDGTTVTIEDDVDQERED